MKIVLFQSGSGSYRVGALVGASVVDLHAVDSSIPASLLELIEGGDETLDVVEDVVKRIQELPETALHAVTDVKLRAPWPGKRIALVGANFATHVYQATRDLPGAESQTVESVTAELRQDGPTGFWKTLDWITSPGDNLVYPKHVDLLDYEGEIAVVLGRKASRIKAADVDDYIWGVTLLNDWSDRRDAGPMQAWNWNLRKNFDGSASLGPAIAVREVNPHEAEVSTRVNDEVRQSFNTREMIFGFGEVIETLTRGLTLYPGDIVSSGTGAGTALDIVGVAHKKDPESARTFLRVGDVVEVSSPGIGRLRNQIVE